MTRPPENILRPLGTLVEIVYPPAPDSTNQRRLRAVYRIISHGWVPEWQCWTEGLEIVETEELED